LETIFRCKLQTQLSMVHLPRIDPEWHDYASEWIIYVMKNVTYVKNGLFIESESTDIRNVRKYAAYGQTAP
jgi:hypothetical protein